MGMQEDRTPQADNAPQSGVNPLSVRPEGDEHTHSTFLVATARLADIYREMSDAAVEEEVEKSCGASLIGAGRCSCPGHGNTGVDDASAAESSHPIEMPSPFGTPRLRPRVRMRVRARGSSQAHEAAHSSSSHDSVVQDHHNYCQTRLEDAKDEEDLAV